MESVIPAEDMAISIADFFVQVYTNALLTKFPRQARQECLISYNCTLLLWVLPADHFCISSALLSGFVIFVDFLLRVPSQCLSREIFSNRETKHRRLGPGASLLIIGNASEDGITHFTNYTDFMSMVMGESLSKVLVLQRPRNLSIATGCLDVNIIYEWYTKKNCPYHV